MLEGLEKAERNLLPILNNLLENREMQLEDGRFLVHPRRFDELLASSSAAELEAPSSSSALQVTSYKLHGLHC